MLYFHALDDKLILTYEPDNGFKYFQQRLENDEEVTVSRTFTFQKGDLVSITDFSSSISEAERDEADSGEIQFILGRLDSTGRYFEILPRVLDIEKSVFFHRDIELKREYFIAVRDISIFKRIAKVLLDDIYIGFDEDNVVQFATFKRLVKLFPNTTELNKYANMRVVNVIREEFDGVTDARAIYEKYRNQRTRTKKTYDRELVQESERIKFSFQHEKLTQMLANEKKFVEKEWQHEILGTIETLFPKYIAVLEEVEVQDVVTGRTRRIDYVLVDATGNIDIIEIKRPYSDPILTKRTYRDNYVPLRELSGTIMQVEKYLYTLNKWSVQGERDLTRKYRDRIPASIDIHIVNPQGIIVMGRDSSISAAQKEDFELIRRKYKNIVDIITYDDLLRRLMVLVEKFGIT